MRLSFWLFQQSNNGLTKSQVEKVRLLDEISRDFADRKLIAGDSGE
jgi:hypothetical protein